MKQHTFEIKDEKATDNFGRALAICLPEGSVIALNGTLGAGKTRLVQAVAIAVGIDRTEVTSPTYVLIHEYQATIPIYHFDVYRLRDDDEFLELGPDEYFEQPAWSFLEWAEKVVDCLPRDYLEIQIEVVSETSRRFTVIAHGERYASVVDFLAATEN